MKRLLYFFKCHMIHGQKITRYTRLTRARVDPYDAYDLLGFTRVLYEYTVLLCFYIYSN